MPVININEVSVDLETFNLPFIDIDNVPGMHVEVTDNDHPNSKKILFIGLPKGAIRSQHVPFFKRSSFPWRDRPVKLYDNIPHTELVRLKVKFRVNYEQVVVYKIIEKINFYDHIVVLTVGFSYGGIDLLADIKRYLEFGNKKIFIVRTVVR